MNKLPVIIVVAVLLLLTVVFIRFQSGEDTWICENNEWVRHGNPDDAPPESGCGQVIETAAKPLEEAITEGFSRKYERPVDSFIITTDINTGEFAKGGVEFTGEFGRGLWFGAKTEHGWELVFDGQGLMSCELANTYNFPSDVVSGCVDTEHNNTFTER